MSYPNREHGSRTATTSAWRRRVSKKHLDAHELPSGRSAGSRTPARALGQLGGVRVNRGLGAASAVADEPELRALREGDGSAPRRTGWTPGAEARPGAAGGPAARAAARARDRRWTTYALTSRLKGQMEHARNPLVCRQLRGWPWSSGTRRPWTGN